MLVLKTCTRVMALEISSSNPTRARRGWSKSSTSRTASEPTGRDWPTPCSVSRCYCQKERGRVWEKDWLSHPRHWKSDLEGAESNCFSIQMRFMPSSQVLIQAFHHKGRDSTLQSCKIPLHGCLIWARDHGSSLTRDLRVRIISRPPCVN